MLSYGSNKSEPLFRYETRLKMQMLLPLNGDPFTIKVRTKDIFNQNVQPTETLSDCSGVKTACMQRNWHTGRM